MVTCVPGHSDCTASASTCAASCRISSSARGSSRLMNSILASCSMGSARSATTPSSAIATVRLASDGEMPLAMSRPVMLLGNSRLAPSGKMRAMRGSGSIGFKLATPNWNPDAGALLSGIDLSCGSLLRTSAGKRERGLDNLKLAPTQTKEAARQRPQLAATRSNPSGRRLKDLFAAAWRRHLGLAADAPACHVAERLADHLAGAVDEQDVRLLVNDLHASGTQPRSHFVGCLRIGVRTEDNGLVGHGICLSCWVRCLRSGLLKATVIRIPRSCGQSLAACKLH